MPLNRVRSFFRSTRQIFFFLIFAVVAAGAYLNFHGLPEVWKKLVLDELAHRGIHLKIASLHLDPFRGVIARGIQYMPSSEKKTEIQVGELALNISLLDCLRKRFVLDHLEVDGSDVQIRPHDGGVPVIIRHTSGKFRFLGKGIVQLESVIGDVLGIRLEINGSLDLTPGAIQPTQRVSKLDWKVVESYLAKLGAVKTGEPILINLEINGRVAEVNTLQGSARVYGKSVSYEGWHADLISGKMTYAEGVLNVSDLFLESGGGKFDLTGSWEIRKGPLQFEVVSNLDPNRLFLKESPHKPMILNRLNFGIRPEIWVKGSMDFSKENPGQTLMGQGSFLLKEVILDDYLLSEVKGNMQIQGGEIQIPNLGVIQGEGKLSGGVVYEIMNAAFRFDIQSTLNLASVMKLLYPSGKNWFYTVAYEKPPLLRLAGRWMLRDPNGLQAKGDLDWKDWSSREVPIQSTQARLEIVGRVFKFQDLKLNRKEGSINGGFELDFASQSVSLDAVSTVAFSDLTRLIGPKIEEMFVPYQFGTPPKIQMKGRIYFEDDAKNDFSARIESGKFKIWKFSASNVSADIHSQRKSLEIARYTSEFYDGRLEGDAVFDFTKPEQDWAFHCKLDQVDFDRFTHDLWDYDQVEGRLTASAEMSGTMKSSRELRGRGEAKIADGVLWKIPLFGELSKFIPILGVQKATKAYGTFTVADEMANVDDMKISAGIMSLTAKGIYKFDQSVDFIVQGHFLRGLFGIGYVFDPFTKAFEYHLGGKLNDRKWKPRFVPKELLLQFGSDDAKKTDKESP